MGYRTSVMQRALEDCHTPASRTESLLRSPCHQHGSGLRGQRQRNVRGIRDAERR